MRELMHRGVDGLHQWVRRVHRRAERVLRLGCRRQRRGLVRTGTYQVYSRVGHPRLRRIRRC